MLKREFADIEGTLSVGIDGFLAASRRLEVTPFPSHRQWLYAEKEISVNRGGSGHPG